MDVSERMVAVARELNAHVGNCRFVTGASPLEGLGDDAFDLVYSNLVLQHVSDSDAALGYVEQLARAVRAGGLLAVQAPSHIPLPRRVQPRRRLYTALRRLGVPSTVLFGRLGLDPVGMHALPRRGVVDAIESVGARIVRIDEADWPGGVRSATYFATR